MVVQSASEAANNALGYTRCVPGRCLQYVRGWLGIDSMYPWAISAYQNAKYKHPGDRTPPRGAPVFWSGGSHGYGHISLSLLPIKSVDRIRSTDVPSATYVGTVELEWVEQHWGFHYEGWTEDLNGVVIPYLHDTGPTESRWASGDVYVSKLRRGVYNSDSVRRLQYRLREVVKGGSPHLPITGNYLESTARAVGNWQEVMNFGPNHGQSVGPKQAETLFGPAYDVHH